MKLLYFDETEKINRIPEEALIQAHTTRKQLLDKQIKENAALFVCSSMLGINHIIEEVIDSYLVELMPKLRKQKWFKFTIKVSLNKAYEEIGKAIKMSMKTSVSSSEYMMDLSDKTGESMDLDLFKLKNAILLEIGKYKFKDQEVLSDMILVYGFLQYANNRYNSVLEHMNKIYPALYDTWFNHASALIPLQCWSKGLEDYLKQFHKDTNINLSDSFLVTCGFHKIESDFSPESITKHQEEIECEDNSEISQMLQEAYEILNIK